MYGGGQFKNDQNAARFQKVALREEGKIVFIKKMMFYFGPPIFVLPERLFTGLNMFSSGFNECAL